MPTDASDSSAEPSRDGRDEVFDYEAVIPARRGADSRTDAGELDDGVDPAGPAGAAESTESRSSRGEKEMGVAEFFDAGNPGMGHDPVEAAYAGGDWAAYEGEAPPQAPWEDDIGTTPVPSDEMTGIWLMTVWGQESPVWLDGEPVDLDDLDIDSEIADRLRDWADLWNTHWHPDAGWLPRARITDYEALGEWLARRVKDASGAVQVTVQPSHLGRSGIHVIEPPEERVPIPIRLMNDYGAPMPVWGPGGNDDFVTEFGVGSFSSEVNARLEAWAQEFAVFMDPFTGWQAPELAAEHAEEGRTLAEAMRVELGPDYSVELDLWELATPSPSKGAPEPSERVDGKSG